MDRNEKKEVESIRNRYRNKEEDKLYQLKKLDREATKPGTMAACGMGIIGSLILGSGMSLCIETSFMVLGIIIGMIGIILVTVPYFLYQSMTRKRRAAIADQVFELSNEITAE